MLIGLISDTHIPDRAKEIPQKVFDAFSEVDLILHAGDLTSLKVIEDLEKIAPVMAIQGNMDRVNGIDLPKAKEFDIRHTFYISRSKKSEFKEEAGFKLIVSKQRFDYLDPSVPESTYILSFRIVNVNFR